MQRSLRVERGTIAAIIAVGLAGMVWVLVRAGGAPEFPRKQLARGGAGVAFVDEETCFACHETEHAAWVGSHHDQATQPATDETVLGDFENAQFSHLGVTTTFFKRGRRFFVNTDGPEGDLSDYEILYTFGVEPLQQYLVAFPDGRLQGLTIAWDTERGKWFHLYPDDPIQPGDPLHWTGRLQRWNDRCAECHSTDLRSNYDAETGAYETTWAAVNVGCQACHGPGEGHLAWAETSSGAPASGSLGLVVDYGSGRDEQLQTCAQCHARRSHVSAQQAHGRYFLDDFSLSLLREDLYHADGQIREEVYVVGSFVQSLMHRRGVVCTDCHNPHTAQTLAQGNALCTRCHQQQALATFPTLQSKVYDSPAHHRHEPGSAGAECANCHMPERTYMVVDPRRDHSIRVPRPDLSVALGTPNACIMCHADRSNEWAADAVQAWFGSAPRPTHYGEAIAAGRAQSPEAEALLVQLAGDTAQPGIARATALSLLASYPSQEAVMATVTYTVDSDPLVRLAAVTALEQAPPRVRLAVLGPLLHDSIASIRLASAQALAPLAQQITDPGQRQAFANALTAFEDAQRAQADQPESNHNLGNLYAALGQTSQAEHYYTEAIRVDSGFVPAQVNLATLYNQLGRNEDAEQLLQRAIAIEPELGDLHYNLGLLLAEMQRLDESAAALSRAADLLPDRARVHYNRGLAMQQLGNAEEAEASLLRAHDLAPSEPAIINGLAFFYKENARWSEAARYAQMLVDLMPGQPGPQRLLEEIQAAGQIP